jgi:ribosomal protein S18 acetylase RimI-like enzyme
MSTEENEAEEIEYGPCGDDDVDAIHKFLVDSGWGHRVEDVDLFRQLLANSTRAVVARHVAGEEWSKTSDVVGFGRAISDDISNGYISMVVVDERYRRRGIGATLVRQLMGENTDITWVVRAGRESEIFWQRVGFNVSRVSMERPGKNRR